MSTTRSSAATVDISAAKEVAAGIAWLDEHQPGWANKIELGTLRFKSTTDCVVCQVTELARFDEALFDLDLLPSDARRLGFDLGYHVPYGFSDQWYRSAEHLWRLEISRRQAAAKAEGQGE